MRLFARTKATFINPQQAMLSTENAIISNMALTYCGSSPAEKKYGLLFPLLASIQSHCLPQQSCLDDLPYIARLS
jgi:hypothetical protein